MEHRGDRLVMATEKTGLTIAAPQVSLIQMMAQRYNLQADKFLATIKSTVFPHGEKDPEPTNEQVAAFLTVAKEYDLNPFIKEIYAFPSKGGGIVPIVSIDGWCSLINRQAAMDGLEFVDELDAEGRLAAVTCKIYRKDRTHPTVVTEYMNECRRQTDPWNKWPARMLRHKAVIQCARYAFALSGIVDPDEAERISEVEAGAEVTWTTPEERQKIVDRRIAELKQGLPATPTADGKEPVKPAARDESGLLKLINACHSPADFNAILQTIRAASNETKMVMMEAATKLDVGFDRESGRFVATAASAPPNPSEAPQPSPKASSSPESTTTATETASPEPESDLIQQEVTVKKAEKRNRRGKGVFWLLTCKIADSDNDLMVHVWHKSFHEYASAMVGKVCDLGLKRTEKDDAVFYSLEDIFQVGDVLYANGKPVNANNVRPPTGADLFGQQ